MLSSEENLVNNNENHNKTGFKREIFEWLEVIIVSVIVVIVLFTFVFKIVTISGDSMKNTLKNQERIVISNLFYKPKNGDIVVISRNSSNSAQNFKNETCIIKRIIATEGQVVNINFNTGKVFVDGIELEEPYISTPTTVPGDLEFPVTVPEGCVFVLGDNRNNSSDSRYSSLGNEGMVDERHILGRAVLRILPFSRFGVLLDE
ncbi:MAG: signal peptidase I [Clostridia bacterium]|nr:signal peptidase I [Clostridia bacterium]